ncbi:hypothetical protein ElyMa_002267500, partial [Elysia marginata]
RGIIAPLDVPFDGNVPWSTNDTFKWVTQTVFKGPKWYLYEDNLQRLLLHASSRFTETLRLNPRGATTAHVVLFSPDSDPVVDVVNVAMNCEADDEVWDDEIPSPPAAKRLKRERGKGVVTTTLRGLLAIVNSGKLYSEYTISTLKHPFTLSETSSGGDRVIRYDSSRLKKSFSTGKRKRGYSL